MRAQKVKKLIQVLLLGFVAVSVLVLLNKEFQAPIESQAAELIETPAVQTETDVPVTEASSVAADGEERVVVYYFHGNMRCAACRAMEDYAEEALDSGFATDLDSGRLVFREVNVEAPGNLQYIREFQLMNRSIVAARYIDGQRQDWKNLEQVWQLLNNKSAFLDYVRGEIQGMLDGAGA